MKSPARSGPGEWAWFEGTRALTPEIRVVLNRLEELKQRVPTR